MRKLLITLYGTKRRVAVWVAFCAMIIIASIVYREGTFPLNNFEVTMASILGFAIFIGFVFFGAYPLTYKEKERL